MVSTDKVKLRYASQESFRVESPCWSSTKSGLDVTLAAGTVTFGNFNIPLAPAEPPFASAEILISGFTGDDAIWNGQYTVSAVTTSLDMALECSCPAGKLHGANVVASTDTVTVTMIVPFRVTGETLMGELNKAESEEITGARGIRELIVQGVTCGGGISGEVSFPAWQPLLRMGLMNDWTFAGAGSDAATDESITFTGTSTMEKTTAWGLSVGDWIRVVGSTYNDGSYKVTAVDDVSTPKVLTVGYGSFSMTTPTETCDVYALDSMTEGSTTYPVSVEREYTDIASGSEHYPRFIGLLMGQFSLNVPSEGRISIESTWVGSREVGTGKGETGTPTSSMGSAGPRINGQVLEGTGNVELWFHASNGGCVESFSLTVQNNLNPRNCVGTLGPTGYTPRRFHCTGSFSEYYENTDRYDKFLTSVSEELVIKLTSDDGGVLVVVLPHVEYASAQRPAPTANDDVMLQTDFTAVEDDNDFTLQIYRGVR